MSGGTKQRINDLEAEIARLKSAQPALRDQFAMAALKNAAECSYEIADAMMEARNGRN